MKVYWASPPGQEEIVVNKKWKEVRKSKELLLGHQEVHGPSGADAKTIAIIRNQMGPGALLL